MIIPFAAGGPTDVLGRVTTGSTAANRGSCARRRLPGTSARYLPELLELVGRLLAGLLGELGLLDLVLEIGELVAAFLVADLILDRLHLFVEKILALGLLHLPLDAAADALVTHFCIQGCVTMTCIRYPTCAMS